MRTGGRVRRALKCTLDHNGSAPKMHLNCAQNNFRAAQMHPKCTQVYLAGRTGVCLRSELSRELLQSLSLAFVFGFDFFF
jgi:hypothetical protein